MTHDLNTALHQLFRRPVRATGAPKHRRVHGVEVTQINGLWTATIAGRVYSNSRLGDLKVQIADIIGQADAWPQFPDEEAAK